MTLECYSCKTDILKGTECFNCGAVKKLDPSSGNPIWMKNGRIISAPVEEKAAYEKRIRDYPHTRHIIRKGEEDYANNG